MKKPRIVAVIPARMASSRFPGKPLAKIAGLPMVEHVWRRVRLCAAIDEVVVATCDQTIVDVTRSAGCRAVMTADTHERCTDRVAEAAEGITADIIVNVQGDEPLIRPELLDALVAPMLADTSLPCANLVAEIPESEGVNPNLVKVVCDLQMNALYFSREPVPSRQKAGSLVIRRFKQLGIIAFKKEFLRIYTRLAPGPLEAIESVDMLRLVEHGYKIRMVPVEFDGLGVDTPQDLLDASRLMAEDELYPRYRR